ncbi:hypothetical protein [Bailinhaonella thermotolerans]|uniref:DUF2336 domain-containing protein n=1 Tax=Bailinhaonella thermotolerans TaxID=1070861 RepID=A0A3A4A7H0_9ACTN|nr:hypothetical protein [Bailinhaonella thermotolerans]RJL23941.1 hypothetical protein D5H75_31380 [Bailinhaonella thermotolerans]
MVNSTGLSAREQQAAAEVYRLLPPAAQAEIIRTTDVDMCARLIGSQAEGALPPEVLAAALSRDEEAVLWQLAQRADLPADAVRALAADGSPARRRSLAENRSLPPDVAERLFIVGDDAVRCRLFANPVVPGAVKRRIIEGASPLIRGVPAALHRDLDKPEFALWCARSRDSRLVPRALNHVAELSQARQIALLRAVIHPPRLPVEQVMARGGWRDPCHTLLTGAVALARSAGEDAALSHLRRELSALGPLAEHPLDEARLLPFPDELWALRQRELPWRDLTAAAARRRLSPAGCAVLLARPDRTPLFTAMALLAYLDEPLSRDLVVTPDELAELFSAARHDPDRRAAVAAKLLAETPRVGAYDLVCHLPAREALTAVRDCRGELRESRLAELAGGLRRALGETARPWAVLDGLIRQGTGTLGECVARAAREE